VPAFLFSIILTAGLSVSGHDGVDVGSSWLTEVADWVHLTGASLWIGGLATMVALVWYGAPELRRIAFFRFSRLAMVLVAVVLTAGTYLSIVRLPHLRDLWTQEYGQVLLVKIALVGVALAWGGVHHFLVRPRLERQSLEKGSDGFGNRVGRSLLGESLVGMAVLLVAAVLVDSKPPPQPLKQPPATQAVRR
jgi:putative copper export protein